MGENGFAFKALVLREEFGYTALCLDLDVASQGESIDEAKQALIEAVSLYLETALENNLPWLRPVPPAEDPRFTSAEQVVEEFTLRISVAIHAYA